MGEIIVEMLLSAGTAAVIIGGLGTIKKKCRKYINKGDDIA